MFQLCKLNSRHSLPIHLINRNNFSPWLSYIQHVLLTHVKSSSLKTRSKMLISLDPLCVELWEIGSSLHCDMSTVITYYFPNTHLSALATRVFGCSLKGFIHKALSELSSNVISNTFSFEITSVAGFIISWNKRNEIKISK